MGEHTAPWADDLAGVDLAGVVDGDDANARLLEDLFTFLETDVSDQNDGASGGDANTSEDSPSDSSVASPPPPSDVQHDGSLTSPVAALTRSPPSPSSAAPTKRRRSKPRQGCPIKRTLDALREEAEQLTQTLEQLRDEAASWRPSAVTEAALTERFKRRRAERECEQLRDAVYAQAQFLRGLQSVFSGPPSFAQGLNLCRHLHNYTRLPRDRSVRWNEYASLAQETRLKRAMDILCRETQSLTVSDGDANAAGLAATISAPQIRTESFDESMGFGVTTASVYAVETSDIGTVLRGACVAVRDIIAKCRSYQCTNMKRQIVDPEASSSSYANLLYRVMGVHHKSLREDKDELSIESRFVTLYKQTDDYAIVLWDFIDDDELHPTTTSTDITRQAIGACLVQREVCEDGVERSVCRLINTRHYRFHEDAPLGKLRRFQHQTVATMRENELLFRGIMLEAIAKEEAAYQRVLGTLQATAP